MYHGLSKNSITATRTPTGRTAVMPFKTACKSSREATLRILHTKPSANITTTTRAGHQAGPLFMPPPRSIRHSQPAGHHLPPTARIISPKAAPNTPPPHVLCLFTGLTKVEMCTDWDGLQFRFPSLSKGRAHKIDIKKTDLQTQAKAFERANPSFTFCLLAPLRNTRKV